MGFSNASKAQRVRELSRVTRNCPMISEHDWKSDCRLTAPRPVVAWHTGQAGVAKMELEASYDESYCLEGRAERQRGATDSTYEAGEAVGMACVDRHIFFITPLMVCLVGGVVRDEATETSPNHRKLLP